MKFRNFALAGVISILLIPAARCQSDSMIHVKEFPGITVGDKVATAQAFCPAAPVPCILVIDASLAAAATGNMPALCANCVLADYRNGIPAPTNGQAFNVKDYGAKGDGSTDDTTAIAAALSAAQAKGGVVFLPPGTYKTTATLNVADYVTLQGSGVGATVLKPVGTFDAVRVWGSSYASFGVGRRVGNLEIDGTNLTGNGLSVKYCGLRCYFHDLYIHSLQGTANSETGIGLRIEGSFDHMYERIESRANASYGVEAYEKQNVPDGVYEEQSYLRFLDVQALENNSGGVQWNQAGGDNFYFISIKPSEGTVGMNMSRNQFSQHIGELFFDPPSAGTGVGLQTNSDYVQGVAIANLYCYQCQYALQVVQGRNISVGNAFGATTSDVRIEATANGAVYLGNRAITYSDANTPRLAVLPSPDAAGVATLSSGTVTVSNAAACSPSASCVYKISNCGPNASTAVGALSLGTVTAGTSFVVNSLSASAAVVTADASTVCWQIN